MILCDSKFTEIKPTCEPRSRSDLSPMQHINQVPRFSLSLRRLTACLSGFVISKWISLLCVGLISGGGFFRLKFELRKFFSASLLQNNRQLLTYNWISIKTQYSRWPDLTLASRMRTQKSKSGILDRLPRRLVVPMIENFWTLGGTDGRKNFWWVIKLWKINESRPQLFNSWITLSTG